MRCKIQLTGPFSLVVSKPVLNHVTLLCRIRITHLNSAVFTYDCLRKSMLCRTCFNFSEAEKDFFVCVKKEKADRFRQGGR